MKLDSKFLESYDEKYYGFHNALGLYDTMQFVLRLRRDIHMKLDALPTEGISSLGNVDFESIQAYSTYLHETIHWWQHSGTTSGLILSLSYPMQTHINKKNLEKFLKITGAVKPITKYNSLNAKEFHPEDEEFQTINIILNNFHDIEFFKYLTIFPEEAQRISKDPYFESIGHSFHITYSAFIHLLTECFDKERKYFPNIDNWAVKFRELSKKKIQGFYHNSDIYISPIGIKALYEGQARFIQLQYLYFASNKKLSWKDFKDFGMLSGIYIEAFDSFLSLTESIEPTTVDDPLIALFLLVLDISINPMEGFPFEIKDFENFINMTDPGIRFLSICNVIKNQFPELKYSIQSYSSAEYYDVSNKICKVLNFASPLEGAKQIKDWSEQIPSLIDLTIEEKSFKFNPENFPIRLMFSKFINFQKDKYNNPAFFCWVGFHITNNITDIEENLFNEHQTLFLDGMDGDIYPRILPNKKEEDIKEAMNLFYTWISSYNLTKQWIVEEGEFEYDYLWLTSKFTPQEVDKWAKNTFVNLFNINPDEFKIL